MTCGQVPAHGVIMFSSQGLCSSGHMKDKSCLGLTSGNFSTGWLQYLHGWANRKLAITPKTLYMSPEPCSSSHILTNIGHQRQPVALTAGVKVKSEWSGTSTGKSRATACDRACSESGVAKVGENVVAGGV